MTAQVTTWVGTIGDFPALGDNIAVNEFPRHVPGTLWERVADNCDVCGEHHPGEIREGETSFCIQPSVNRRFVGENIPERVERIARDHNIPFREALRVAFAESRLEAARAVK